MALPDRPDVARGGDTLRWWSDPGRMRSLTRGVCIQMLSSCESSGASYARPCRPCSSASTFPGSADSSRTNSGRTFRLHGDQLLYAADFAVDEDDVRNLDRRPALARRCRLEVTGTEP